MKYIHTKTGLQSLTIPISFQTQYIPVTGTIQPYAVGSNSSHDFVYQTSNCLVAKDINTFTVFNQNYDSYTREKYFILIGY